MSVLDPLTSRWPSERARFLFRQINDRGHELPLASVTRDGGVEFRSDLDISVWNPGDDISGYKRVLPGDFVIGLRSFQSGLGCSPLEGLVSPAYSVLRPRRADMFTGYFRHLLKSEVVISRLQNISQGIRQGRTIAVDDFNELPLPLPPLSTQRAIANYLDRETTWIDALIAAKRRMIDLLVERRRSMQETLVSEARHSGASIRLGHLLCEVDDRLGSADAPPLLSVSIHQGVIPFGDANPDRVPRSDDLENYKRCSRDDIVLNRMRAFQGGVGRAMESGIVSPDYAVLRPVSRGSSGYLNHLLRSPWFVGRMEFLLRGIGGTEQGNVRTPRVNWNDLRTVIVPSPPLSVQVALVERLDSALTTSWKMQRLIERQISVIQERRKALIIAAVAGQLDIPEAA